MLGQAIALGQHVRYLRRHLLLSLARDLDGGPDGTDRHLGARSRQEQDSERQGRAPDQGAAGQKKGEHEERAA